MNYKAFILATSLLLWCLVATGQQVSDSKTFRKSFKAEGIITVDVTNKYGSIHISQTDKDSVSVRVEAEATSDNENKLKGMMSGVDISITKTNDRVIAQTVVGKSVNSFLESFKGITKSFINYDTRLQINYFIECPHGSKLVINNSYGDVYISDPATELTLTLANGSLDAGEIENVRQMNLSFCKAEIRNVRKGQINLNYGEMRCDSAGDISLVIRASKTKIGRVEKLNLDSKRDDITIEEAGIIRGSSFFSDITISALTSEAGMVMKYGNFTVNNLLPGFSLIDLNTSYTDVDFTLAEKSSYDLEIRHTNAYVSLPGLNPEPERTTINADSKIYLTTGKFGHSPDASRIRIEANRGEIRIVQK
jgi:hypothetical protein